ncbi:hypothetical protein BT69DRAFT_1348440 [Atractiella rhizophila]|nr:hypothetical protein BT69DRAFT_1348440 [Atractiella rhizophila]
MDLEKPKEKVVNVEQTLMKEPGTRDRIPQDYHYIFFPTQQVLTAPMEILIDQMDQVFSTLKHAIEQESTGNKQDRCPPIHPMEPKQLKSSLPKLKWESRLPASLSQNAKVLEHGGLTHTK